MKRKSIAFIRLICLIIASLFLLATGCKKKELNMAEPSVSFSETSSPKISNPKISNPETSAPETSVPLITDETDDPVPPEVTTTAPEEPAIIIATDPTPPATTVSAPKVEVEVETLDQYINLDDCIHGEWKDSGDYGVKEKELFNQDGETIGLVYNHTQFKDQSELETYILFFGLNDKGEEIDRHFYGSGVPLKTVIRHFEADTKNWIRTETYNYDVVGWWWMTEIEEPDGRVYKEGVFPGRDNSNDPEDGFTTFYQLDYREGTKQHSIYNAYEYDKNGDFVLGFSYDSKVDDSEGEETEAPAQDPWRTIWMETFEASH